MNRRHFLISSATFMGAAVLAKSSIGMATQNQNNSKPEKTKITKIKKSDAEWKRTLSPEQYYITRQAGMEAPFTSPLLNIHDNGVFECVCCDLPLFSSKTKFDSGTGWPSFWAVIDKHNIREQIDTSLAETRTETLCARCDAHLGHVFPDGPKPTGLRYCMNGIALKFVAATTGA